jgi:hypothetical protein
MSGDLVNAFGKITLDATSRDVRELLEAILVELKMTNIHLAKLSDEKIDPAEIERYGD